MNQVVAAGILVCFFKRFLILEFCFIQQGGASAHVGPVVEVSGETTDIDIYLTHGASVTDNVLLWKTTKSQQLLVPIWIPVRWRIQNRTKEVRVKDRETEGQHEQYRRKQARIEERNKG